MNLGRYARRAGLIATAIGVLGALAWAFRAQPPAVDVARVDRGPVIETIVEEGRTRIRERYTVTAPVASWMPRFELHAGDPVAAGALLAELRPVPSAALDPRAHSEAEARVAQAAAALRAARQSAEAAAAGAAFAARDAARLKPLAAAGTVAASVYDQAQTVAERAAATAAGARSGVEVARFELHAAESLLRYAGQTATGGERLALRAPIDGVVLKVHHEDEGVLAAAAPVVTLGDPASLDIEVEALSTDAIRLQPGMRAEIDRWGGAGVLAATVRRVEPVATTKISALGVEEQRALVLCDIVSPRAQWSALGDGYAVEVRFILREAGAALRVPTTALFRTADGWAVFAVREGRAQVAAVRLGALGVEHTEVLGGLDEGDEVVIHPDAGVRDGGRVTPRPSPD